MKFSFRFRDWRIQTKLLVIFVVLSWIPVVILMGLNLLEQLNASQIEMENQLLRVVSSTVRDIQINASKYIKDNHVALQLVAEDSVLLDAVLSVGEIPVGGAQGEGPQGEFPPPPGQGGPPTDAGSGALSEGGAAQGGEGMQSQQIPSEIFANEYTEAANDALLDYEIKNDGQQEIGLYNLQGIVIAASQIESLGMVAVEREDISAALAGNQYTESIHLNPENNAPGFFIAIPMISEAEVVGVVSSRLQAQFIVDELSSAKTENEEMETELDIFIVDPYGLVMAHTDPEVTYLYHSLGELSVAELAEIEASHLLGQIGTPTAIPALQPLADELRAAFDTNKNGSLRYCMPDALDSPVDEDCSAGAYYMAGFDPLEDPITGDVLFMIVTSIPEAQFVDPIKRQAAFSIGGAAAMSFLLFAVAFVIARTMAQPIKTLMSAAETVESDEPFDPETLESISAQKDELGKLATVFTKMAKVVQERELKLRQTVEKLRIEIDQSKRKKEVDEIVEGDFFKDLQDKAREAKEQRKKAEEEDEEPKKD